MALGILAFSARKQGDFRAAKAYLGESIMLSREIGDLWNTGMAMMSFGIAAAFQGDFAEAKERFDECLTLFRKIGDKYRINMVKSELAHLERRQRNYQQALDLYHETILAWQRLGHRAAVAHQLECIGFINGAEGNVRREVQLLGAAATLREQIDAPMSGMEREDYDRALASAHQSLDEASFAGTWEKGRAMTMEEAIGYALEPIDEE